MLFSSITGFTFKYVAPASKIGFSSMIVHPLYVVLIPLVDVTCIHTSYTFSTLELSVGNANVPKYIVLAELEGSATDKFPVRAPSEFREHEGVDVQDAFDKVKELGKYKVTVPKGT